MSTETFSITSLGAAANAVVSKLQRPSRIERIAITDRAQWLSLRRQDVTASTISTLIGVSEYQSYYSLWAQKSGLVAENEDEVIIEDDFISLSPMGRGTLFEDKAAELLRRLKPSWQVIKCCDYYRDPAARIGATPDLIVFDPARGRGVVQIKNPEPSIYREKWKQEDGSIEPPLDYVVQTNVEADLTEAKWAAVGVLIIGHRVEFRLIDIPIHDGLLARLREAAAEFWRMVETKITPPFDYERDGELVAKIYGADNGTEIDLSSDNMLPALAAERDALKEQIKEAEERCKAIETEFKSKIGDHAVAILADRRSVSWKTQHRKAYQVEASSFRVLRFGKAK